MGQNARILSLISHETTQDPVSACHTRREYAIVTSHYFGLIRGADGGLNTVEERGVSVCDDQGTIRQRLNRAVRKGEDRSKEGQKTLDLFLLGFERRYGTRGNCEHEKSS